MSKGIHSRANKLKRFFLARSTVLVLLLLLTAAMIATAVFPQTDVVPGAGSMGQIKVEILKFSFVDVLGLRQVFSTRWFATLLVFFLISLALSTIEQFRISRVRMLRLPGPVGEGTRSCNLSKQNAEAVLTSAGYRRFAEAPGASRYVRFWPGYWGAAILHCGILCTVLFCAIYVMTEHRVVVRTIHDVPVLVTDDANRVRQGLFWSYAAEMPASIILKELEPRFYPDGSLQYLASLLEVSGRSENDKSVRVAVSDKSYSGGTRLYQKTDFGVAFRLRLQHMGSGEAMEFPLWMPLPGKPGKAGYLQEPLQVGRYTLKAKFFPQKNGGAMLPLDPRLALRLMENDRIVAEQDLKKGDVVQLGPWLAGYTDHRLWSDILLEGSRGVSGIFFGFFLILIGSGLAYFVVPREVEVYYAGETTLVRVLNRGRFAGGDDEIRQLLGVSE